MIFRQLFDRQSSTFTYLLAERSGGEALLIDPVLENTEQYVRLIINSISNWYSPWTVTSMRIISPPWVLCVNKRIAPARWAR